MRSPRRFLQSSVALSAAFAAAVQARADAITVGGTSFFVENRPRSVGLAAQHRLPAMYSQREFAEIGGLMTYAANQAASYRRSATYVGKILKGAKPGDLPIEQPTEFDLVINAKTAHSLGLTIPPSLLRQATEVIQ